MMKFPWAMKNDALMLSVSLTSMMRWSTDSSFMALQDMRSHAGDAMTMDEGSMVSDPHKQKLNTRSSSKSELVAADDTLKQKFCNMLEIVPAKIEDEEAVKWKRRKIMRGMNK